MGEENDRDLALLLDMMLAAGDARSFVADMDYAAFTQSRLHQNAVIRSIEVIGEAAGKISSQFCDRHPDIPWREITGMRHRLIHGYADVQLDIVWYVVSEKLPGLVEAIKPHISESE